MTQFKAGEKCAYYSGVGREIVKVEHLRSDGMIQVSRGDGNKLSSWSAHPKQCRRLRPKAKPLEFWIPRNPLLPFQILSSDPLNSFGWVHLREVRVKK